jgi:hypothetical protein
MQPNNSGGTESTPTDSSDIPPSASDRFSPSPLSPMAKVFLKQFLARVERRRRVNRVRRLRVCIDGKEDWQGDPGGGGCGPFSVPLTALYVEVFGDDDDGALLLAVFPLPEPAWMADDRAQHLRVTLEGGQTIETDIWLGYEESGKLNEYVIRISYSEPAEVDMRDASTSAVEALSPARAGAQSYPLMLLPYQEYP